ncbi:hypothetical protein Agub_g13544 [Astrephomene gubernaculifera]|uniref:Uncharacterized protein n=1 Tax=Astrephomene gubernaculifera TaxID=47775 RepID=A0AAD3E1J7_9CHLO|nr:hypothetical protein Agub_g13544 [Astrephomene gubernaculifera]
MFTTAMCRTTLSPSSDAVAGAHTMDCDSVATSLGARLCCHSPSAHARHDSPFTTGSQTPLCRPAADPVSIPNRPGVGLSGRQCIPQEPLDSEMSCSPSATSRQRMVLTTPQIRTSGCASLHDLQTAALSGEGAARRARILDAPDASSQNSESCQALPSQHDIEVEQQNSLEAVMRPVASLPLMSTQAPVSLADLCTALSSPVYPETLAAVHQARDTVTGTETTLSETTAAISALMLSTDPSIKHFNMDATATAVIGGLIRSISSIPATSYTSTASPAIRAPMVAPRRLEAAAEAHDATTAAAVTAMIDMDGMPSECPDCASYDIPMPASAPVYGSIQRAWPAVGSCTTAAAATSAGARVLPVSPRHARPQTSTKRGLYEGTVRGGVPYNLWQYCTTF